MNSFFFFASLAANKPNVISLALAVSVHACVWLLAWLKGGASQRYVPPQTRASVIQ